MPVCVFPSNASINKIQCMIHGVWNTNFSRQEIIY